MSDIVIVENIQFERIFFHARRKSQAVPDFVKHYRSNFNISHRLSDRVEIIRIVYPTEFSVAVVYAEIFADSDYTECDFALIEFCKFIVISQIGKILYGSSVLNNFAEKIRIVRMFSVKV